MPSYRCRQQSSKTHLQTLDNIEQKSMYHLKIWVKKKTTIPKTEQKGTVCLGSKSQLFYQNNMLINKAPRVTLALADFYFHKFWGSKAGSKAVLMLQLQCK